VPKYYEVFEAGTRVEVKRIPKDEFPKKRELKDGVRFVPEGDEKTTILELGIFHWLAQRHEAGQRTVCKVNGKEIKGWFLNRHDEANGAHDPSIIRSKSN
jgi:hypothetical protein